MAIVQFRCDEKLKNQATKIYEDMGMDLSTAMRLFLVKSVSMKGLPFNPNRETQKQKTHAGLVDFEEISRYQDEVKPEEYEEY